MVQDGVDEQRRGLDRVRQAAAHLPRRDPVHGVAAVVGGGCGVAEAIDLAANLQEVRVVLPRRDDLLGHWEMLCMSVLALHSTRASLLFLSW